VRAARRAGAVGARPGWWPVSGWTRLDRGLWARLLGALDPGTDPYLRQLVVDFPRWVLWRPPSPDGGEAWWGARDGHTVIITGTPGKLRAALVRQRETAVMHFRFS
jgi:hypothetical protein